MGHSKLCAFRAALCPWAHDQSCPFGATGPWPGDNHVLALPSIRRWGRGTACRRTRTAEVQQSEGAFHGAAACCMRARDLGGDACLSACASRMHARPRVDALDIRHSADMGCTRGLAGIALAS